jgi:hypothetical protein
MSTALLILQTLEVHVHPLEVPLHKLEVLLHTLAVQLPVSNVPVYSVQYVTTIVRSGCMHDHGQRVKAASNIRQCMLISDTAGSLVRLCFAFMLTTVCCRMKSLLRSYKFRYMNFKALNFTDIIYQAVLLVQL